MAIEKRKVAIVTAQVTIDGLTALMQRLSEWQPTSGEKLTIRDVANRNPNRGMYSTSDGPRYAIWATGKVTPPTRGTWVVAIPGEVERNDKYPIYPGDKANATIEAYELRPGETTIDFWDGCKEHTLTDHVGAAFEEFSQVVIVELQCEQPTPTSDAADTTGDMILVPLERWDTYRHLKALCDQDAMFGIMGAKTADALEALSIIDGQKQVARARHAAIGTVRLLPTGGKTTVMFVPKDALWHTEIPAEGMVLFQKFVQRAKTHFDNLTNAGAADTAQPAQHPTSNVTIAGGIINIGGDVAGRDITKEPPSSK